MMQDALPIAMILPYIFTFILVIYTTYYESRMHNATTTLLITPLLCQYRDKPAHVTYSIGKYRKNSKSAALGFTRSMSQTEHSDDKTKGGWSSEVYNVISAALVIGPIALYHQIK